MRNPLRVAPSACYASCLRGRFRGGSPRSTHRGDDVGVDEKEQDQLRAKSGTGAVCAHIGLGADNEQAKVARDRLAAVLAEYRRAINAEH